MPKPVTPLGRERFFDAENEGQRQDRERKAREDEEFFRITGKRRPPTVDYSPLVDENPSPDIANDGDSYVEDQPSEIFNPVTATPLIDSTRVPIRNAKFVSHATERINEQRRQEQKEKSKEDIEFQKLVEKSRNNIGNAIEGLDE